MVKFSKVGDLDQYPLFKISAVGTPHTLALEPEADLEEQLLEVLV